MSSTCFDHPSVHPQEDLYMQFYGTFFMSLYKQSGRCRDVLDTIKLHVRIFMWMNTWLIGTC
jgi:hypothetical protein